MSETQEHGARVADDGSMPLLTVEDVKTWFHGQRGTVHAVDGVSFSLLPGETLGILSLRFIAGPRPYAGTSSFVSTFHGFPSEALLLCWAREPAQVTTHSKPTFRQQHQVSPRVRTHTTV